MHSKVDFASTTKASHVIVTGREATSDGVNSLMARTDCREHFFDSIEMFDVHRSRRIGIGRAPQHDFEGRWQRVEH